MAELTDKLLYDTDLVPAGQAILRDSLKGFFVVIGGRQKTFKVQCDVKDDLGRRRTKKVTLGTFPHLNVKQARAMAKATIGRLQTTQRFDEKRKDWTLGDAWAHMREFELPRKGSRPRTIEGYAQTVDRLMPAWLNVPLRKFADKPHLVEERHFEITKAHGPYTANGFGRTFRRLYRYAQAKLDRTLPTIQWGQVITWNAEKRDHSGMSESDLGGWFGQLAVLRNAVRREMHLFLLLSGSRPEALCRTQWDDLDLKRRALRIREPKGGPDRAFSIPLSREMLKSLIRARKAGRKLAPKQSATFIFPSPDSATGHIVEWKEDRATLSKWGKQLRQSYVIAAESLDISERTLKRLLNHKTQDVTMGYGDRDRMWGRLLAEQERISAHLLVQRARN